LINTEAQIVVQRWHLFLVKIISNLLIYEK